MAVEEISGQSSERRRRSRAGSNLNVSFNGGGVVLLLGAAAGALLASVFAAQRIRAHNKRGRISTAEGILGDSGEHLDTNEGNESVGDEGGDAEGEEVVQVNLHDNLDASVHMSQDVQIEKDFYLLEGGKEEVAERSPKTDVEINSSPANACFNLGIDSGLRENKMRYEDEEMVAACVKEICKTTFISCKKNDAEDIKKAYIDEWGEKEDIEENFTSSSQYSEQPGLIKKDPLDEISLQNKAFQNLELVVAIEEKNSEDGFKDEMYNSILGFVPSRTKAMETSSPSGQDELNPIIKEIEPLFEGSGKAEVLDVTQNDSDKNAEVVILEDENRMDSGGFKNAVTLDILFVEQDNDEGSRGLCKQTVAFPYESTVASVSEPETSTHKDSVTVMAKEDLQLMDPIDGIINIEEDKMGVEEGSHPLADEVVEGLIDGTQGIEICIGDNSAMIPVLEKTLQLEDNANCDLKEVIQEEKTEENLMNGLEENVESSETEYNLRENEERPLTKSQRIEYSLEQDNLIADKGSPCLENNSHLSLESNMKIVRPIKDNNLKNSDRTLEIEEFLSKDGAEESRTCSNEEVEEKEDEAISVLYHELETCQFIEPHKDKVEREIECPQTLPSVKKGVDEIHKESKAQIKEEDDDGKQQNLKLSFDDLVEKRLKTVSKTMKHDTKTELIAVARKHQQQLDCHENNVSSKGKQRIATIKVKGTEHMFMGYPKGHIVLLMTIATAFAVLALLYSKYFAQVKPF